MIALEIPLMVTKITANLILFFTIYLVWLTGKTPGYAAAAFFAFNISGLLFLSVGFKENIVEVARGGAFVIFVSYVLVLSFLVDQIVDNKKRGNREKK